MITLETLEKWLKDGCENEHLEFKEAKKAFDETKVFRYCAAIANEGGGNLVLGVSEKSPKTICGSQAFSTSSEMNAIKNRIVDKLDIRVDIVELNHSNGRVIVFIIPSRPKGLAIEFEGAFLMRAGESLKPMTQDLLKRIFEENKTDWLLENAKDSASADDVAALLDTQTYFELLKLPYPTSRDGVIERLENEELIKKTSSGWNITNLAAILLAKKLDNFPLYIARKAPRVIIYDGINKVKTREEKIVTKGYAVGFDGLVEFIHAAAPQNHFVEQTVREEIKMFPKQALRELIANALVHQDFIESGTSIMIEMYNDRIEISNPGKPPIEIARFIDENKSRNERLAYLMRKLGICEEKGSGVDKVVQLAEDLQLPAPDFIVGECRTTSILFAHQDFSKMSKADRVRACFQHCCLMYVSRQRMSNQTLRDRFGLSESRTATISSVIGEAKESGLIKVDDSETASTRYAKYLPYWA